jgi:hypothetical protein
MRASQETTCRATAVNHCCWLPNGKGVCPHFDSSLTGGFCSLRAELGSWELVHIDVRYERQRDAFESFGTSLCGDYPLDSEGCGVCEENA